MRNERSFHEAAGKTSPAESGLVILQGGVLLLCEKASSWLENIVLASTLSGKRRPQKRLKFNALLSAPTTIDETHTKPPTSRNKAARPLLEITT